MPGSNVRLNQHKYYIRNDEFYTNYQDIEDEVSCYRDFLRGKTVLCPCDNPYQSNFFRFFVRSFNELGIRRLVTSCYSAAPVKDLFSVTGTDSGSGVEDDSEAERLRVHSDGALTAVVTRVDDDVLPGLLSGWSRSETDRILSLPGNSVSLLKGDGDFRSEEVQSIMRSCDVIVTNPPFSLFRDFFDVLTDLEKDFLIVGPVFAATYKNVFPRIIQGECFLGKNKVKSFISPDNESKNFGNIRWFASRNNPTKDRCPIELTEDYSPEKYTVFDNYDAINIPRVSKIPKDYDGVMGVPVTFLDKWDPEQFEIVGLTKKFSPDDVDKFFRGRSVHDAFVNGVKLFERIFIRHKNSMNPSYQASE